MPEETRAMVNVLQELQVFSAKRGNAFAQTLLEESIRRLREESFTLVIMGEFKRGKSTFINALLGSELVPTGIVPLTAIPTIIEYGSAPSALVTFENGDSHSISTDEITLFVTEKENPRNEKQVREVRVYYPAELLRQGVILVDTPGVGSVYQHNTDAAYAYLPHSDVAVFLISVDAPVGQSELAFLGDIRQYVHNLIFVINKIDILAPGQLEELLTFTQKVLKETLETEDITIFPLSARQALEAKISGSEEQQKKSRFTDFERRLNDLISGGKSRLVREVTSARALRVISELEMELALWQKAMEGSLEDITEKVARFEKELTILEREREDSIYLLYRDIDGLGRKAEERLRDFRKQVLPVILGQYRNFAREAHGTPKEIGQSLKEKAHELIEIALAEHREQEKQLLSVGIQETADRFFRNIEEIVDRMMTVSSDIFGVSVELAQSKEYILGDRNFSYYFHDFPTFYPPLEDIPGMGLIPGALVKKKLVKTYEDRLVEYFELNCGRTRSNLIEVLKEVATGVAGELRLRADLVSKGLTTALQDALRQREAGEHERQEALAVWQDDTAMIQRLKAVFKESTVNPK